MRKWTIWVLVLLLFAGTIAGCAKKSEKPAEKAKQEVTQLVISTGGTSGSYFAVGGAFANIISKYGENLSATAQTSGGSIENLKLLESGESELILAQNDLADYALKGAEMFKEPLKNVQAIATLYPEYIQIVVRANLGVKKITDLKGKKISVGPPGSGSEANARQFLQALGVAYDSFKPQFLSNTDATNQFKDKIIDGFIITSGLPSPAIMDIASTMDVTVVGFTNEEIAVLAKDIPFLTAAVIPANSYNKQTQDVQTIAAQAVLFTSAKVPEEVVYRITKAIWDNQDELILSTAKAKYMKKDNPVIGVTVPVHPGAAKYYKEKGIAVK